MKLDHARIAGGPSMVIAAVGFTLSTPCFAEWPDDPTSPLVVGGIQGIGSVDHQLVTTPDGATWAAWVDTQCAGSVRVQRIDANGSVLFPDGLPLSPHGGCVPQEALLAPCADGSVVVSRVGFTIADSSVLRIAPDGGMMWGDDGITVSTAPNGRPGQLLGLANGEALVAWNEGGTIVVQRYSPSGAAVWESPASFSSPSGSNMSLFALIPDSAGGAFVFWDTPLEYVRRVWAARVTADGAVAWNESTVVVPPFPGSSRHTDPVAIPDGSGGAVVVWTRGVESAGTIVPMFMQRVFADGSLAFAGPEGVRISLDVSRQFDAAISQDEATGDLFVAWRDGVAEQNVRAQRLTLNGERLFGDSGVGVTSIGPLGHFDAHWNGSQMFAAVSNDPGVPGSAHVVMHRIDGAGVVNSRSSPISDAAPAGSVRLAPLGEAVAASWLSDGELLNDFVVAQRVNADGSVGLPTIGDLNGDGVVNGADLAALLAQWGACGGCAGDLDENGFVNGADLASLLANWSV